MLTTSSNLLWLDNAFRLAILGRIHDTLKRFVDTISEHPNVASASSYDRTPVRAELEVLLLAHNTQVEDSTRFQLQKVSVSDVVTFDTPRGSYYN